MKKLHREHDRLVRNLIFGLLLFLAIPYSFSIAQAVTPITPSGLNTHIGDPTILPGGQTVYDITGGTRPGNGPNLFHSFGDFNVPNHNIANFLNDSGLPTSNILGRVTGGNVSNIFGMIQTTGFGNANLFLMNPAGFLFGPTATVNVGGMMTFTTANYLNLADGVRFNSSPTAAADLLLSTAPVAAFGFLGSNPGAITVQGSQLSVADGAGISLVGGNITMQSGTLDNGTVQSAQLSAPSGQINLVSVGKPSKGGGEVVVAGSGQDSGFTPTGFQSMRTINLSQGSTVDVSNTFENQGPAGNVVIRGGQFVMDNSSIWASTCCLGFGAPGSGVEITANDIALSNGSTILAFGLDTNAGDITLNANTVSVTNSVFSVGGDFEGGAVTIQGLQGSGTYAHAVSLRNTSVFSSTSYKGGPITILGDNISLNNTDLFTTGQAPGGSITLVSRGSLGIQDSQLYASSRDSGGPVDLRAGTSLNVTSTFVTTGGPDGSITMAAPNISLHGSRLDGFGTTISITGRNAVSLTNGTALNGETVLINGGARFTSQQSTISAQSRTGNGGTIHVDANNIVLTASQLNTSTSGDPGTVGGSITVNGNRTTLTNSQILSTATEGQGGTIHVDANNIALTASQLNTSTSGGPGTVGGSITVNGNRTTLTNSQILSTATEGQGGTIHVDANNIALTASQLNTSTSGDPQSVGGSITVNGNRTTLTNSQILSTATEGQGGTIHVDANNIALTASQLNTSTSGGPGTVGGSITVNGNRTTLTNSQILSTATEGQGGTIHVDANNIALTASQLNTSTSGDPQSVGGSITVNGNRTTLTNSQILSTATEGQGGTIHVDANNIALTASQLNTSTSGGPGTVGGSITVNGNRTTLTNSQILSTATEGQGGTINITSPVLHRNASSVIDASSQSGTNGTVTINGVIQP